MPSSSSTASPAGAPAPTETDRISRLTRLADGAVREPIVLSAQQYCGIPHVAVPTTGGWEIKSLEHLADRPLHLDGSVTLGNSASFLSYVNTYKGERSVAVYADPDARKWVAVFDHHTDKETGWRGHRAVLPMPLDKRFEAWLKKNNEWQTQTSFAEFLEDHAPLIRVPSASEMIDIVTDLKVHKAVDYQSTKTLRNGNLSVVWDESTKESREVPLKFTLQLPVLQTSHTAYEVTARLRYRIGQNRELHWMFVLDQLDELLRTAWQRECEALSALDGVCPVFVGTAPPPAAVS